MCYKILGNICYVTFLGEAPVACKTKWGGPGQPPGLSMLMTTTEAKDFKMCPRCQGRSPGLHLCALAQVL